MILDSYLIDTINSVRPDDENEDIVLYIDNSIDNEEILGEIYGHDYIDGRNIESISSDLPDFNAYYLTR